MEGAGEGTGSETAGTEGAGVSMEGAGLTLESVVEVSGERLAASSSPANTKILGETTETGWLVDVESAEVEADWSELVFGKTGWAVSLPGFALSLSGVEEAVVISAAGVELPTS